MHGIRWQSYGATSLVYFTIREIFIHLTSLVRISIDIGTVTIMFTSSCLHSGVYEGGIGFLVTQRGTLACPPSANNSA
eukprot:1502960-Pyramimonas_sp.AAC.4